MKVPSGGEQSLKYVWIYDEQAKVGAWVRAAGSSQPAEKADQLEDIHTTNRVDAIKTGACHDTSRLKAARLATAKRLKRLRTQEQAEREQAEKDRLKKLEQRRHARRMENENIRRPNRQVNLAWWQRDNAAFNPSLINRTRAVNAPQLEPGRIRPSRPVQLMPRLPQMTRTRFDEQPSLASSLVDSLDLSTVASQDDEGSSPGRLRRSASLVDSLDLREAEHFLPMIGNSCQPRAAQPSCQLRSCLRKPNQAWEPQAERQAESRSSTRTSEEVQSRFVLQPCHRAYDAFGGGGYASGLRDRLATKPPQPRAASARDTVQRQPTYESSMQRHAVPKAQQTRVKAHAKPCTETIRPEVIRPVSVSGQQRKRVSFNEQLSFADRYDQPDVDDCAEIVDDETARLRQELALVEKKLMALKQHTNNFVPYRGSGRPTGVATDVPMRPRGSVPSKRERRKK